MEAQLGKLSLNTPATAIPIKAKKKVPVADSWDEESASSSSETEEDRQVKDDDEAEEEEEEDPAKKASIPDPPPPTPASPRANFPAWNAIDSAIAAPSGPRGTSLGHSNSTGSNASGRPQKSTAVASRLIAAGLGVRAPKRTEEQRAYDRAAKENEIRRRNKEKEDLAKAQAENEKAKAAVWDA